MTIEKKQDVDYKSEIGRQVDLHIRNLPIYDVIPNQSFGICIAFVALWSCDHELGEHADIRILTNILMMNSLFVNPEDQTDIEHNTILSIEQLTTEITSLQTNSEPIYKLINFRTNAAGYFCRTIALIYKHKDPEQYIIMDPDSGLYKTNDPKKAAWTALTLGKGMNSDIKNIPKDFFFKTRSYCYIHLQELRKNQQIFEETNHAI